MSVGSEWTIIAQEKTMDGFAILRWGEGETHKDVKIPATWLLDRSFFLCLDNKDTTELFIDQMHVWMEQNGCMELSPNPVDNCQGIDWHIDMNRLKIAIMNLDFEQF